MFIAINVGWGLPHQFLIAGLNPAIPLAQDARLEELCKAEDTFAQKQVQLAQKAAQASQQAAELAATDARKQADMALLQARYGLGLAQAKVGTESIDGLLVLTSQTKAEDLAMIIEDLSIMSRILDKKIDRTQPSRIALLGEYAGFDKLFRGSYSTTQTQAMYVQGYAALFFMNVDFPLSPPPQVQIEKVKEGADQVWEQTKWEMTASNKDLPLEYMHQRDATARQYDKDVVEQLKTNLVKTLKHAANMRNLKADESVILVVAGTRPGVVVAEEGAEPHRYKYVLSDPAKNGEAASSILTIRAKKADIDAYAAAKTDYDQFRQRTAILTSRASLGPEQAEHVWSLSQNLRR
jgi:hypothetical protein